MNGGKLQSGVPSLANNITVTLGSSATLSVADGLTGTFTGVLTMGAAGSLTVGNSGGTGTTVLDLGAGTTFNASSTFTVAGGTVKGNKLNTITSAASSTTVASGATLDFGNIASTIKNLQGAGTVTTGTGGNNLTISAGNFSGKLTGSMTLTKDTAGTLVLSGANDYAGRTLVSAGTLQAGAANTFASTGSGFQVDAGATLDLNGFNQSIGYLDGSGTVRMAGARLTLGASGIGGTVNATFVSDTASSLVKEGAGTVTLANAGTPFAGHVTINGGAMAVASGSVDSSSATGGGFTVGASGTLDFSGNGGATTIAALDGSGQVNVGSQNLVFANARNTTFAGRISGGGGLVVNAGAGVVVLNGANNYTGATTVNTGGSLYVGSAGTSGQIGTGAVSLMGDLTFDRSDNFSAANVISGSGTLGKRGTGTLTLTGDSSAFTGAINVNNGTLAVNGRLGGSISTGAATLGGTGFVNNVQIGQAGTLAPGNSIGTLTVNGNLSFGNDSIYRVEVDGNGAGDKTVVGGNLTISNTARVDVQAGGTYTASKRYTILTNTGTRTGTFGSVTSNLAFLAPTLSYDASNVFLDLAYTAPAASSGGGASDNLYTSVAGSGNQYNVAKYLGQFVNNPGSLQALIDRVNNMSAQQAREFFASASGTQLAGASTIGGFMSRGFGDVVMGHAGGAGSFGDSNAGGLSALRGQSLALGMNGGGIGALNGDAPMQLMGMNLSGVMGDAATSGNIALASPASASYSRPGSNGAPVVGANGSPLATMGLGGNGSGGVMARETGAAAGMASRGTGVAAGSVRDTGVAAGDSGTAASGLGLSRASWGSNVAGQNGIWGQALGLGGRVASDGNGAGSSYRGGGFVVGYDRSLTTNWLVGVAGGYTRATWDASINGTAPSNGKVTTPQGSVYARYSSGPWMVSFAGNYADHKFDTTRTITIGTTSNNATSSHRGDEWGFATQAEYALAAGAWQLRPLAGLRYMRLKEEGFSENGSSLANLTVAERTTENTTVSAGMRVLRPFNSSSAAEGGFEMRVVYSHLFGDNDSPISARLAGQSASFTANGTPLKRDAVTIGGGVSAKLGRNFSGYLDASYEARGSGQDAYAIGAGVRYRW